MTVKAVRSKKSLMPGIGEITYLGQDLFTAVYFLSFERLVLDGNDGDGAFNFMTLALNRLFERKNLVHTTAGVIIREELGERVRNPHGLIRNRLCLIQKTFNDICTRKVPLTREELGLPEDSPSYF